MSKEENSNILLGSQVTYLRTLGKRVLSEANELGLTNATVQSVIGGNAPSEIAQNMLARMCDVYSISMANVWIDPDDTNQGFKIFRADASLASSRKFSRVNNLGNQTVYYEYRDTAMSRASAFKPEWIQPMRVVEDDDPDNLDVAYNKGHLMHQCTFIIGAVNFYWEVDGKRHCSELDTGDSNYITPFVPHSFTSRDPDNLGLIIAVTFGSSVRNALNEFSQIGAAGVEAMIDGFSSTTNAFNARLNRHLAADSLTRADLIYRLAAQDMGQTQAAALIDGDRAPSMAEISQIAIALNLRIEDLIVTAADPEELVIVRKRTEAKERPFPSTNRPAYMLRELARSAHQPGLRGFELEVLNSQGSDDAWFRHSLHQYVYNYGRTAVQLYWGDTQSERLESGDSAYIQPMIKHRFSCLDDEGHGNLVIVRIPGTISDSAINEFSRYPKGRRARASEEMGKWF